jgi:hypothetical protein
LLALIVALVVIKSRQQGRTTTAPAAEAPTSAADQQASHGPASSTGARLGPSRMGWMQSPDLLHTTSVSTTNPVYGQFDDGADNYDDAAHFVHTTGDYADAASNPGFADARSPQGSGVYTAYSPFSQTNA